MTVTTRFAPSPTGKLHIGNARAAILNWLYARKNNGKFILRFDDTDLERSKEEYKQAIARDLKWLGLEWDETFNQSCRIERYEEIKQKLLQSGRLYPCFESPEELEVKRKFQLSSGRPPIYDRASLKLTKEQTERYISENRRPHYRFLIEDSRVSWTDLIKGELEIEGGHLSDPVVIREDGTMTYMLCSVVDDMDYNITHIIRGEDHVTNTAVQIQMFKALGATARPEFAHFSMVTVKDEKISKRTGGFEIESLREEAVLEPMAIDSFFTLIGSSAMVKPYKSLEELAKDFDIDGLSKSPTTYVKEELDRLNHKLLLEYDYNEIRPRLLELGLEQITEEFWLVARPNLEKLSDLKTWWQICFAPAIPENPDKSFLEEAAKYLPEEINTDTWKEWTSRISAATGKKGKELFIPLRLAITGQVYGPELKNILPLLSKEEILKRLNG